MRARKGLLCLMLASMLLVLTTMGAPIAQAPSDGVAQVTINGTTFMVNGAPYMFRGVNVQFDGLHHEESGCQSISRTTFDLYKSWNVNLLRVWLNMEMASSREGTWTQGFFDKLETMLDLAEEYGMYVLISGLHSYGLAPKFDGTGFPDWMFSGISTVYGGMDMLYKAVVQEDPAYQNVRNAIRDYVHRIASMSQDRNIVMGYDIFNEPPFRDMERYGYSSISASYFYEALSEYYTEIDPYKPQAVENNFIDNYYKPKVPNLFVAPHGYAAHTYDYSLSQMRSYFRDSGYWVQGPNWGVPTLNAEWFLGNQREASQYGLTAAEIASWYNRYITAMEDLGIGWAVLRCEASPSSLHWSGTGVKNVLLNYWELNTVPYEPPPQPPPQVSVFADGFETGNFDAWNGIYTTSGETATVGGETTNAGAYSAKFTSNGGSGYEYAYAYKTVDLSEIYVKGSFYIAQGLPLDDNDDRFTLIQFLDSRGSGICGVQVKRVSGEDRFFLYGVSGSSSVATQSATGVYPQEDVWYSIELYAHIHATGGAFRVFVDGVELLSLMGIDTSRGGSIAGVRVGLAVVTNVQDYVTVYCDNVVFDITTGDVDGDGDVDIFDVVAIAGFYGTTPADDNWNPAADLNRDGKVDISDMIIIAAIYQR